MNIKLLLAAGLMAASCAASGSVLGPGIAELPQVHAEFQILVET